MGDERDEMDAPLRRDCLLPNLPILALALLQPQADDYPIACAQDRRVDMADHSALSTLCG